MKYNVEFTKYADIYVEANDESEAIEKAKVIIADEYQGINFDEIKCELWEE